MKIKIGKMYKFSNYGKNWELLRLDRKDKHVYPYCAGYSRWKYIKEVEHD